MIPPVEIKEAKNKYLKLNKSLYGLKQASYEWNKLLINELKETQLEQSKHDPCFFFFVNKNNIPDLLVIHVDDVLIFSQARIVAHNIRDKLAKVLEVTYSDNPSYYIGYALKEV